MLHRINWNLVSDMLSLHNWLRGPTPPPEEEKEEEEKEEDS